MKTYEIVTNVETMGSLVVIKVMAAHYLEERGFVNFYRNNQRVASVPSHQVLYIRREDAMGEEPF